MRETTEAHTPRARRLRLAISGLVLATSLAACSTPELVAIEPPNESPTPSSVATDSSASAIMDVDALWETFAVRHPNAQQPEARFVRYVDANEIAQVTADCLIAAGWTDVTVRSDGGIAAGPSDPSQQLAFDMSMFVCMVEYPLDPRYSSRLSEERLALLHDYYIGELTSCLEREGYRVSDAPSKTTFVETFYDVGWTPYVDINNNFAGNEDSWVKLNEACPQWPSGFFD